MNNSRETESQYNELNNEVILNSIIDLIPDECIDIDESLLTQREYLGYINNGLIENPPSNYATVSKAYKKKDATPYLVLNTLTGKEFGAKISKKDFNWSINEGSILEIREVVKKHAYSLDGEDEFGKKKWSIDKSKPKILWVTKYRIVEKKEE